MAFWNPPRKFIHCNRQSLEVFGVETDYKVNFDKNNNNLKIWAREASHISDK